jgi:molybdenum cofactor cytidylyltransferase
LTHVVILAAGIAERFGSQKLLHPLDGGDTLLARAVRAAAIYPAFVVCSEAVEAHARTLGATTVRNDAPERGMSYSLRLADAAIDPMDAIAVMPADLLLVTPEHVMRVVTRSKRFDVTYPARADGAPGHPVVFSFQARRRIRDLRDNEPIAHLRDGTGLSRSIVESDDAGHYRDVDVPADLQ